MEMNRPPSSHLYPSHLLNRTCSEDSISHNEPSKSLIGKVKEPVVHQRTVDISADSKLKKDIHAADVGKYLKPKEELLKPSTEKEVKIAVKEFANIGDQPSEGFHRNVPDPEPPPPYVSYESFRRAQEDKFRTNKKHAGAKTSFIRKSNEPGPSVLNTRTERIDRQSNEASAACQSCGNRGCCSSRRQRFGSENITLRPPCISVHTNTSCTQQGFPPWTGMPMLPVMYLPVMMSPPQSWGQNSQNVSRMFSPFMCQPFTSSTPHGSTRSVGTNTSRADTQDQSGCPHVKSTI